MVHCTSTTLLCALALTLGSTPRAVEAQGRGDTANSRRVTPPASTAWVGCYVVSTDQGMQFDAESLQVRSDSFQRQSQAHPFRSAWPDLGERSVRLRVPLWTLQHDTLVIQEVFERGYVRTAFWRTPRGLAGGVAFAGDEIRFSRDSSGRWVAEQPKLNAAQVSQVACPT